MMMMMVMTMTVMMTMCFQLLLQRLADSRGSALGALVRTHYTGCCGLRSTARLLRARGGNPRWG